VQILGGSEKSGAGLTGDVELVDAESGERVMASIGNREREQYAKTMARLAREIRTFCLRHGLHYTLYTTDLSFHDFFLRASADFGLRRH
jgi:hypothetical protein